MEKIVGAGGSLLCAALGGTWWMNDARSFWSHGWLVVIALGVIFTALVHLLQRDA